MTQFLTVDPFVLLAEVLVLSLLILLELALDVDNIENNEKIAHKVPAYTRVLIDDLVTHVLAHRRQLLFAVIVVNPVAYLSVEVDHSADATEAID